MVKAKKTAKRKLTAKQEQFCQEFMIDLNATQATIRAKYPEKSARTVGCENLAKPNIQARITELREEVAKNTGVTIKSVINGIVDTRTRAMDEGDEFMAELKASDMLMRHVGGYEKDNEIGITDDLSDLMKEIGANGSCLPIKT